MKQTVSVLCTLLISMFMAQHAWGWAHLKNLDNPEYRQTYLIYAAVQGKPIKYCIANYGSRQFSDDSLRMQISTAFSVWDKAFSSLGVPPLQLIEVGCRDKEKMLEIRTGPNPYSKEYSGHAQAFVTPAQDGYMYMHLVVLEGALDREGKVNRNMGTVGVLDLQLITRASLNDLSQLINALSFSPSYTPSRFFSEYPYLTEMNLHKSNSYWTILHEIGHTFGLSDTDSSYIEYVASEQWRSRQQGESIMRYDQFFKLTADDRAGLKSLITRVKTELGLIQPEVRRAGPARKRR